MGGGAAEMGLPEEKLRHYNNMQQQKARFARPQPGPRETDRMREEQAMEEETDEEGQYTGGTPPMPARPAMATPRVRPPMTQPAGAPPPMSGGEMTEANLLQALSRKSMSFERAWGLLKARPAPFYSSTHQGYEEDPLLSEEGQRPVTPRMPMDPRMEMSDEDYLNMLLGEARGPKMGELADEGAEMEMGDLAGMGEEGAGMARHHMARGPAAGQSRAQPPMDAPPAPPQMPPRGQRALDDY